MESNEINQLKKRVHLLSIGFFTVTALLVGMLLFSFVVPTNKVKHFDEITANKVTITEPNGSPRMVLANSQNSPANLEHGKTYGLKSGGRPGIIFYNDEQTECGGLVFTGRKDPKTGQYFASGHFSFDQYDQNQVLYLQYLDDNGFKKTGLYVDDWHNSPSFSKFRKEYKAAEKIKDSTERAQKLYELRFPKNGTPAFANRVFLGKDGDKNALLNLSDATGNVRLQLKVDSLGNGQILFFNDKGDITSKFPNN